MHSNRMIPLLIGFVLLMTSLGFAGGDKRGEHTEKEYDFADKIVYFVTKPKDSKSECGRGMIEKARVVRLGDRPFLVGQIPDYGEGPAYKAAAGKTLWTPISEIVQLTEFKNLDDAKQYFEAAQQSAEKAAP